MKAARVIAAAMGRRRRQLARALCGVLLWGAVPGTTAADAGARPQRIVSTNLCTDQLLLRLVEPERIVSLTFLSWEEGATPPELLPALKGLKQNHGLAEQVLMMDPDLVVGGTFSARFSNDLMAKLGLNIELFKPENNFEEWYAVVRRMGDAVGEPERAERVIADFKAGLARLKAEIPSGPPPIYANLTGNNWMPGDDTLFAEVVNAGGFTTAGQWRGYSGYRGIPLEELIQIDAELVSVNTRFTNPPSMTTAGLNHPLLREMVRSAPATIEIPSRYIVCTTPETLKMVEALVEARKQVESARRAGPDG